MELNPNNWGEWLKVWPSEYRKKFYVNYDSRFYTNKSNRYNIFYNTKWKELDLEIRGNCLFGYDVNEDMGKECGPVMGWILEHVTFKLGIPTHLLTLPSNLDLKTLDDSSIIYFHENNDLDLAFLAIFCQYNEDTNDLLCRLKQCSLTFLKSSIGKNLYDVQPSSLALKEKAEISTNIALNRLESLKYEHEFLRKQQNALKLDNTLLATQASVKTQLYSETMQLQLQENSHLKNELEMAMKEIILRDDSIKKLKKDMSTYKQIMADTQNNFKELQQELECSKTALDEANLIPDKKLRVSYTRKAKQVNMLSLQLLSTKFDNSKLIAKYHSLKNEMKSELEKIHDLVECDDIYELLKLWIACNELKVEYYENLPDLNFQERNKLLDKINNTQFRLNIAMTVARATYITYRTVLFDQVLTSFMDNKPSVFGASYDVINSAFEKLSWIFNPDNSVEESSDTLWSNSSKITRLMEKTLYNNNSHVWYNRVSFASAIKPIVKYEQEDRNELEIKKRLYYCLDQNSQLRQKLRSLSRQIGSDYHWKSIWKKTHLKKKSSIVA